MLVPVCLVCVGIVVYLSMIYLSVVRVLDG